MNNNVRKITDGAMMVALIGLLVFIDRQFAGMITIYATWLVPLPMVVYAVKYGWKSALIPFVSVIFLAFIIAGPQTWFYVCTGGISGIVYGNGIKKGWTNSRLLLTVILFSVISNAITSLLLASFFGYDIVAQYAEITAGLKFAEQYLNVKLPANLIMSQFLAMALLLIIVLTGLLEGTIIHLLSNFLLTRMKIKVNALKPLSQMMISKWTAYVCLVFYILSGFPKMLEFLPPFVAEFVLLLGTIGMYVLVFFGYICCLLYGMVQYHKNVALYVILLTFLLLPIMLPLLAIVGFLYVTTDMRQKILGR